MWTILLLFLALPLFLCAVNATLNRIPHTNPHKTPFTAGLITNVIFLPLYAFAHIGFFDRAIAPLFCGLLFALIYMNCMVFLNWFIFTLTDVSMHIQLLMQLSRLGSVKPDQLAECYNKNTILANRVPRLLELGQLRLENGRLFLNGGAVLFGASVCMVMRKILGIPERPEEADHSK